MLQNKSTGYQNYIFVLIKEGLLKHTPNNKKNQNWMWVTCMRKFVKKPPVIYPMLLLQNTQDSGFPRVCGSSFDSTIIIKT